MTREKSGILYINADLYCVFVLTGIEKMEVTKLLVPILLFALGFLMLIKGGDWFVDGSVGIAHRFNLPEILIGATVVSVGTTLPEVMVSSQAALQGNSGISYGNAIGSIICNVSLIAAITIAAKPGPVDTDNLRIPAAFFTIAAVIYMSIALSTGKFQRWHGVLLLAIFVIYMICTVIHMKNHPENASPGQQEQTSSNEGPLFKDILKLFVGAVVIAIGANLLVNNGTLIAQWLGVPDSVIGLTMIALGTSLPELVTAITSLLKGHGALSLGNIIGANLFNLVLVSGTAILLSPFKIPSEKTIAGINSSFVVDLPVMILVMIILCVPVFAQKKLSRWQGIVLLCIYSAFTAYQFLI